jgi:hypothetical protein
LEEMIRVRAAQEKNTSSAAVRTNSVVSHSQLCIYCIARSRRELYLSFNKERVRRVIELDQYRFVLNEYQSPLNEVRDSL